MHLRLIDTINDEIARLDARIEQQLASIPGVAPACTGCGLIGGGHSPGCASDGTPVPGLVARLDEITGVGVCNAQVLIAELGTDASVFPTPGHAAAWARLTSRNRQSGASAKNGRTGKGNPYLRGALGQCVMAAARTTDTRLGAQYRRIGRRRGKQKAIVAVSRVICEIAWILISDPGARFADPGPDYYSRANPARQTRSKIREIERLNPGMKLTPHPDRADPRRRLTGITKRNQVITRHRRACHRHSLQFSQARDNPSGQAARGRWLLPSRWPLFPVRSPERPVLSVQQVIALADAIDPRYRALVLLAVFGCLRWGELAAIQRKHIDLNVKTVRITRTLTEVRGGGHVFGPPKSAAGYRTVAFPAFILPDMSTHMDKFTASGDDALVFTSPLGTPLRNGNFRRRTWAKAIKDTGLHGIHFHDLRHTGNNLTAEAGASLRELMERMATAAPGPR